MLVQFSVSNFRSFLDNETLSMVATKNAELQENLFDENGLSLLNVGAIFGANASGKSNLIHAVSYMKMLVVNSFSSKNATQKLPYDPFALLESEDRPKTSSFEVVFIKFKGKSSSLYQYGFELNSTHVFREWLRVNQRNVFEREEQNFHSNKTRIRESGIKEKVTGKNTLFLSVLATMNTPVAREVLNFFQHDILIINGLNTDLSSSSKKMIAGERSKEIVEFLREGDFAIQGLSVKKATAEVINGFNGEKLQVDDLPADLRARIQNDTNVIESTHNVYNASGDVVRQAHNRFEAIESTGTREYLHLAAPILDALQTGKTVFIDEFGAALHPLMSRFIIRQFRKETNPSRAQLIFNTQSSEVMENNLLRRDQIWFVQKNQQEVSHLIPMSDFKKNGKPVRSDLSYQKNYLDGRFGAIPIIKSREEKK